MKDQATQYLWIDSTTLPVCKNQRIQRHKSLIRITTSLDALTGGDTAWMQHFMKSPNKCITGELTALVCIQYFR